MERTFRQFLDAFEQYEFRGYGHVGVDDLRNVEVIGGRVCNGGKAEQRTVAVVAHIDVESGKFVVTTAFIVAREERPGAMMFVGEFLVAADYAGKDGAFRFLGWGRDFVMLGTGGKYGAVL